MGGNLKNLKTSKNSFIFGDGPSTPSLGKAKITICGYIFSIDIVSRNVPGLIGIDILTRRYNDRSIFDLKLGDRMVIIDDKEIDLLGETESHLHLPDEIVEIYERSKLPRNTTNMSYFQAQPEDDLPGGGSRGQVLPGVGRRQLGEASPSPKHKMPEKVKLKTTLEDIKTEEMGSVRLRKKDYDRPDVVLAKKEELDKFFKFSVIKTVPKAPKNAEIMLGDHGEA